MPLFNFVVLQEGKAEKGYLQSFIAISGSLVLICEKMVEIKQNLGPRSFG